MKLFVKFARLKPKFVPKNFVQDFGRGSWEFLAMVLQKLEQHVSFFRPKSNSGPIFLNNL